MMTKIQAFSTYLSFLEPKLFEWGFERKSKGIYKRYVNEIYHWLDLNDSRYYPSKGFGFMIDVGIGHELVDKPYFKLINEKRPPAYWRDLNAATEAFRDLWDPRGFIVIYVLPDDPGAQPQDAAFIASMYIEDGALPYYSKISNAKELDAALNAPIDFVKQANLYQHRVYMACCSEISLTQTV